MADSANIVSDVQSGAVINSDTSDVDVISNVVQETIITSDVAASGPAGQGVPVGGNSGEVLAKASATDYDTEWVPQSGGGGGGGFPISDGVNSISSGTAILTNANGVSFSINGQTISGSVRTDYQSSGNYLTTARASNDAIGLNTAVTNVTATINSSGFSLNAGGYAGTGTTVTNATMTLNSNGLQFNGGAYLTTAAASNHSHGNPTLNLTNLSGTTASASNGFTLSLSAGNYLTTARASNDAVGLNTAQTNVTWTVNSSGLSLNAGGYAGTNTATTGNISVTLNTSGISINAPAFLTTAAASNAVVNSINGSTGTFSFMTASSLSSSRNGNSISFGLASDITSALQSAGAYLTTAAQSNAVVNSINGSTGTFSFMTASSLSSSRNGNSISFGLASNITTALAPAGAYLTTARASNDAIGLNTAQTNVTWTVNSSGLSLNAGGYAGTVTAATNATFTLNSAGLSLSVAAPGAGGGVALYDGANSITSGTARFTNANGVTFTFNGQTISGSVATTYRASNDAIGLNTAQSNVTWTVNSSGISLDGRNYAGTATSFNGANISGSITNNSAGLSLSMSVAAPGAAAENNWVNLLGANTAGNTTASGSTIGYSGINLTLSGTNASVVNISAPATSSLSATGGISLSTNGSTISVGNAAISRYMNVLAVSLGGARQSNSVVSISPIYLPEPLALSAMRFGISFTAATAANNSSASRQMSASAVIYSRNGLSLSSILSGSMSFGTSHTSNATASVNGPRELSLSFANSTVLTHGEYWVGLHLSTATTGTGGNTTGLGASISMLANGGVGTVMLGWNGFGSATTVTRGPLIGAGYISTGATQASVAFSSMSLDGAAGNAANYWYELNNYTAW